MNTSSSKGFTLVELLISISIFTIITTVSVFNYSAFNSSVGLTNLAYEIALSVRQAQFYGITVKQSTLSGFADRFDSGYGVHFEQGSPSYVLFEDTNVNHVYAGSSETLETYNIQRGNRIGKICVSGSGGSLDCSFTSIDLSFVRPNPDTFMAIGSGGNPASLDMSKNKAVICLVSPKGTYRKVTVEASGQISVSTDATVCI